MPSIIPSELITGPLKQYEEEIVTFFQIVGDSTGLNYKATRIFAYLRVYEALTQKQLKSLTHFSSSTISTTLNSFIQSGIVSREIATNARLGIYRLKSEKAPFVYTEFSEILTELESLDEIIIETQKKINLHRDKYPKYCEFIWRRLNSFRNYIEAQRRAIDETSTYTFFEESISYLGFEKSILSFPDELEAIVKKFITELVEDAVYDRDDPIANIIFTYIGIYGLITQEWLVQNTGLSLSTISRTLNHFVDDEIISALPKKYKQSRFYEIHSVSLSIIAQILKADAFIFSWKPKFEKFLYELERSALPSNSSLKLIKSKISQMISQIDEFEHGSKRLEKARDEILNQYNL